MIKRCFILLATILLLQGNVNSTLLANEKPLVAIVKNKNIEPYNNAIKGFKESLSQAGISFIPRVYDWDDEFAIAEIKKLNPAVIFTLGTSVTQSMKREFTQTPIIFSMVVDPVSSKIKADNIVGISLDIPVRIQFQMFKQVVPGFRSLGVLYNPSENAEQISVASKIAQELGIKLVPFPVNHARQIPAMNTMRIDALWIIPDNTICQAPIIKRLLLSGLKNKVPVMGISPMYAKAGALLALSCNYRDIGRQAGAMAGEIMKGGELPAIGIKQPRQVKLYLNQAVAERLNIVFSRRIIRQAEQVFGR